MAADRAVRRAAGAVAVSALRPRPSQAFAASVAIDTCHCGAGCTLGDILAELLAAAAPGVLVWFGLGSVLQDPVHAGWVLDTVLAFVFGIAFQYYAIKPMSELTPARRPDRARSRPTRCRWPHGRRA